MNDWSPNGKFILFSSQSPTTARDLWILPVDTADRKPTLFVGTPAEENNGTFSADGRWIAYVSDETGRPEVFVRPFPGPGRAVRVSTSGGGLPYWRRDGKELFYSSAGQAMAVPIASDANGAIEAGTPKRLFAVEGGPVSTTDGQRFLVARTLDEVAPPPITVIVNWRGR